MTTMYVTEFESSMPGPYATEPGTDQAPVSYAGGAAASAAFKENTQLVRVHVDSIASIAFGTAPVAVTNSNRRMIAGQTDYYYVPQGQNFKVSAVTST